jgi:uncharacterized protein YbdZ (MbtH family)
VDPTDEQVIRTGHVGRRVRLGIAAAVLLVVAATAKPWTLVPVDATPTPPAEVVAVATSTPPANPTPTAAPIPRTSYSDWDNAVCVSPDGWRVVADSVQLGRSVRSWVAAAAAYSFVPPISTTIPRTLLVSHGVSLLGFCVPAGITALSKDDWSATLWRQGGDVANPTGWRAVGSVTPPPGSLGAPAAPFDRHAVGWPPGKYFLEARFEGSLTEAWLGLVIVAASADVGRSISTPPGR